MKFIDILIYRYVCETESIKTLNCPTGWISNENDAESLNACYLIANQTLTYDEAVTFCSSEESGAVLYRPSTAAENTFVTSKEIDPLINANGRLLALVE